MKLNNKGEIYIYVIIAIIILALVMIFGLNFTKYIPKKNTDINYKSLRDSIIKAGQNYIVDNDFTDLEDYSEDLFEKKEANGLDRNLHCNKGNIICKQVSIDTLVSSNYLNKVIDPSTKEDCDISNAYIVIARVISNNASKDYNYYYKLDNVMCDYKRIVNTSETEYYVNEN